MKIEDSGGIFDINHEQMLSFHGGTSYGGIAIAYKVCEAVKALSGTIDRRNFVIFSAMQSPGLTDGLECLTRAVSRKRLVFDKSIAKDKKAPEAPNGYFYFEILHNGKKIHLSLRHGLLPEGFTFLATKCRAGLCRPHEEEIWNQYKKDIGETFMALDYEHIFNASVT